MSVECVGGFERWMVYICFARFENVVKDAGGCTLMMMNSDSEYQIQETLGVISGCWGIYPGTINLYLDTVPRFSLFLIVH